MAVSDLIRSGFLGVYQKRPFLTTIFDLIRSGLRPSFIWEMKIKIGPLRIDTILGGPILTDLCR